MATSKVLTSFFEENILNQTNMFLLYKDKELLKQEKYGDFAREQLKKIQRVSLSIAPSIFFGIYFSVITLIEYGNTSSTLLLVLGLLPFMFIMFGIYMATKEYYSIKSSMSLFLKLLEEEKNPKKTLSTELKN